MGDSRFVKGRDPIRNPKTQQVLEDRFMDNYSKAIKLMLVEMTKILKNKGDE